MRVLVFSSFLWLLLLSFGSCQKKQPITALVVKKNIKKESSVVVGAERKDIYMPWIVGKRVAIFTNQTGKIRGRSIAAYLKQAGVHVTVLFAPEHGLTGQVASGAAVGNGSDPETGLPVRSLYTGNLIIPAFNEMKQFDVLLFDIQDVGVRFYTYYISMVKMMDVCADYHKTMIVLDRPNPNGYDVDGPILDMKYKSGVGLLPIPVMHGMTLGELALMANGEHWLSDGRYCDLRVVPCLRYTHHTVYVLPITPSPNLPNMKSVYLYPSLCLFEGTNVSVGRGTGMPFQAFGVKEKNYWIDLRSLGEEEIRAKGFDLTYLIEAYHKLNIGDAFFTPFFEKLIGVGYVRKMIEDGKTANEIKAKWKPDVERFKRLRKQYLLYPE